MSGRYRSALKNLTLLQDLIRKDPSSYKSEFIEQYRHFQQTLKLFLFQPSETDYDHLLALLSFISHICHLFPEESQSFGPEIMEILRLQASKLDPELRLGFCKALILLRNRKVVDGLEVTRLMFDHLMKVHDKNLRKFIYKSIVAYLKVLTTTKGKRDPKMNSQLQSYVFSRLKDSHSITVRTALMVSIESFRKQVWQNAKTANAVAECCFNRNAKIQVTAMKFFLGRAETEDGESDDSDSDSDADTQGRQDSRSLKEIMVGFQAGKKSRKRKKLKDKAVSALNKAKKDRKAKINSGVCNVLAIQLVYDPQEFAERLLKHLEKSNDRFEVKLMQMSLISRVIGVHQLLVLGFYPYLHRYLQPHQREVTKILLFAAQASHEMVVPEVIETMVRVIVNNFVTDRNSAEVITVGLNAVREILYGCPLAIGEDLLRDLAEYKKYRNKNVSMAAKSLIQLFRSVNPGLLHRKDRGKPTEATKEIVVKQFAALEAKGYLAGAECLDVDREEEEVEEADASDGSDSDEGSWIDVPQSDQEEPHSDEGDAGTSGGEEEEDGLSKEERAELVSSGRILSQEDFRKIHLQQLRKKVDSAGGKNAGNMSEKRKRKVQESVELAELNAEQRGALPKLSDIERMHKKPKQNKESRLESVAVGREGREKFGRPKPKGPHVGKTNKKTAKNKNFMMVRQKQKSKGKRSYREKQRALEKYMTQQRKMK